MGKIQYPDEKEFRGPWLLSRSDLEKLGDVILEINVLLEQSWENKINREILEELPDIKSEELISEVAKRKSRIFERDHRIDCQFISKDGTKLSDSSISGLLRDSGLSKMAPSEIVINISHGSSFSNKFDISLSRRFDGALRYELKCYDPSLKEKIQYKIDSWIEENQPNEILKLWTKYAEIFSFILFFPLIILLSYTLNTSYTSYSDIMKKESYEIIKNGIDSTNIYNAIELLLKSESGHVPDDFIREEKPREPIYLRLLIIGVFVLIIGIIKPQTTLGIGRMKAKYKFYLFWIKVVTITLPAALIFGPFWKNFTSWLY